jgi:hypothetical protein
MKNQRVIIGLTGVKGSGKSTFATTFNNISSVRYEERMLAFKLKEACSKATQLPFDYFELQSLKETPLPSPIILDDVKIMLILQEFNIQPEDRDYERLNKFVGMQFSTPRKMLQNVGTELLRMFDEEIHCNFLYSTLNEKSIVTDVRFENEFHFFKNKNDIYLPIYIHNEEAEQAAILDGHPSEMQVFKFKDKCLKIDNNVKTIDNMERQIKELLGSYI